MNFILSPIYALFSIRFYRSLLSVSMLRGILYILYLSAITTIVGTIIFHVQALPQVDVEAEYFIQQVPEVTYTPTEGLSSGVEQPYSIKARNGEVVAVINTNLDTVDTSQMGQVPIYVTGKKVYFRSSETKTEVYDLISQTQQNLPEGQVAVINADNVMRFYEALRRWSPLFFLIVFFIIALALKLIAAFFYSLIALILNLFRKARLGYSALFNITAAAMTPIWLLQILTWVIPPLGVSYKFLVSLGITVLYQAVFIFLTHSSVPAADTGE